MSTEFNFPWKRGLLAVFGLMALIVVMLLVMPVLLVLGIKLLVIAAGPGAMAWLHQHAQLVNASVEGLCYVGTFSSIICVLRRFFPRDVSLTALVHANFADFRKRFLQICRTAAAGYVIATAAIVAIYALLPMPKPDSPAGDFGQTLSGGAFLIFAVLTVIAAPIFEEIVFRGFVFNMLRASLSNGRFRALPTLLANVLAVAVSGAFFAGIHHTLTGFPPLFITGMALAVVYKRTDNLFGSMTLHFINNAIVTIAMVHAMAFVH